MRALCAIVVAAAGPAATAVGQAQVVASLPWLFGQTAGPNGTNYQPPEQDRTLWVVEDFSIASGVNLARFESYGTVFPSPIQVLDVTVRIYDDLPTVGNVVLASVPGTGSVQTIGLNSRLVGQFGGQFLPAGSYFVVWNASTNSGQIAIFWAQGGPHAVGGGEPENAWQWNPGGAWGYKGNIRPVPAELGGGGQTGVNFVLYGEPGCYPNCDGSATPPVLNVADFTCFLQRFAAGEPYANCDQSTTPPILNVADFTCFLQAFAAGCP